MAPHLPHVRTKRPLHGRRTPKARPLAPRAGQHAPSARKLDSRIPRRGPRRETTTPAGDLAFRVGAGGVMLAATILGLVLGIAHPTWMLAAVLLGTGGLLATYLVVRARHTATAT